MLAALFIALSFVGSNVKVMGTIAFDSLPAFFGALLLGPAYGALIGLLGHLFSALLSGFPFGLPTHAVIAAGMALTMLCFGYTYRRLLKRVSVLFNLIVTGIVGLVLNGPVLLCLTVPLIGTAMAVSLAPALILAAAANIAAAVLLFRGFEYGKQLQIFHK